MDDLRTKGKVTRVAARRHGSAGHVGHGREPRAEGRRTARIVSSVAPGSAAERAGVKRGDVIKSFNGQPVHDINTLRNRVAESGARVDGASSSSCATAARRRLTVKLDEANPEQVGAR